MTFRHTTRAEEEAILRRYAGIMRRREARDAHLDPERRRVAWDVDDMLDRVNAGRAVAARAAGAPAAAKEELNSLESEARRDLIRWKQRHRSALR